jgi:hypothetical protein
VANDATAAVDYAKDVLKRTWNDLDANFSTAITAIERHPTAHAAYLKELRSGCPTLKGARP